MITAKDDFMFDREMMQDLVWLAHKAGLNDEEITSLFDGTETVNHYEELKNKLLEMQVSPLEKARRGETLRASEINQAVFQAAKNDK